MRIGIALICITDLIIRAGDLTAHYTNNGVLSTDVLYQNNGRPGMWSIHGLSGSYGYIVSLFIIHFVLAFLFLIGYKTRIINIFLWLMTMSLQNRNVYVTQAGDELLRLVLLWGIFLPWGNYFSVDSRNQEKKKRNSTIANVGYLLLISSVYFFSAAMKTSVEWHSEGSAVYYALSLEQMRLPSGDVIYQYPELMKCLTHFVIYAEYLIPLLILFPIKKSWLRILALIFIFILQIGFACTLYVGLFFIICIVSAIGLIPGRIFERFISSNSKTDYFLPQLKNQKVIRNFICYSIIIVSLGLNFSRLNWVGFEFRKEVKYVINFFGINQYWGMFAPSIMKEDGWFVYQGFDEKGKEFDLKKNSSVIDYSKPERIVNEYKTDRQRKLAENIQTNNNTFLRPSFCKYILKKWNEDHPENKMKMMNLIFMEKKSLPDFKNSPVTKKILCTCNDN